MRSPRSRLRVAAGLSGLLALVGALLAATPSDAAETGTLHIEVVDPDGTPQVGLISPVDQASTALFIGVGERGVSSHDFVLPVGRYGVMSFTRWAGVICAGISPCDATDTSHITVPGAVDVVAGQTTTYTVTVPRPATVSGKPKVGSPLSVALIPSVAVWDNYMTGAYGTGVRYQWVRDGIDVAGATASFYVPVLADAGHALSVRLSLTGVSDQFMTYNVGDTATTRVIGPLTVPRLASRSRVAIGRSPITTKGQTTLRVDVTAGQAVVTGKVVVTVGKRTSTLTLLNGRAVLRLAKLKKGTYVVRATYRGSAAYLPSTSAKRTLVVKPAR